MAEHKAVDLASKLLHVGPFGDATVVDGSVTPSSGALASVYVPVRIPGGVRLTGLEIDNADLDSNVYPDLVVKAGYRPVDGVSPVADDDYFGSGLTILQSAGRNRLSFAPITFQKTVEIIVTVTTAAATFAAGRLTAIAEMQNLGVK